MTSPSTLPAPLRRPLVVLAGRLRRLRLLRGVSAVVLFLALGLLLLFAADHWLKLTPFQLWAGEIVLAVGSLAIIGFLVLRPLCRRADAHALAALIERRYPQLCERLTSSVALVERRDLTNGAPVLVELLFAQTADQTQGLDVSAVAPVRASLRLAAAALAALLLTTATAALSASAQHFIQRLWNPVDPDFCCTLECDPEPVRLDAAASRVTVTPPPYVDPVAQPPQTQPPLTLRTAVQHGAVAFDLRFTRPVAGRTWNSPTWPPASAAEYRCH